MQKRLGEPHRPDRQADHVVNVPVDGKRELTTAAPQIDEQRAAVRDASVGEDAKMDEAALFQSGDDLYLPAGSGAHPIEEGAAVFRVTQGAGSHHAHAVGSVVLGGPMKAPQHLHGLRHRLRVERPVGEDALPEARHLAVFVQGFQAAATGLRDLQPDGIRANVNRRECWHVNSQREYQLVT